MATDSLTMATTPLNIKPTKCALKYKPPFLILFYSDLNTGKRRRRSLPLRNFTIQTNVSEYASSLYNHSRHKEYLSSVKREQLESLLEKVRIANVNDELSFSSHQAGDLTLDESLNTLQGRQLPPVPGQNKTSKALLDIDDELERILRGDLSSDNNEETIITENKLNVASLINQTKNRQSLPPLPPIATSKPNKTLPSLYAKTNNVFPSALDDHKFPLNDIKVDNDADYSLSKEPLSELEEELDELSDSVASGDDTPLMTSDHLKLIDTAKMISSDDEDYNKMSQSEYDKRKEEMDKQFELERIKPNDPNFVYDKEEDYGKPTMESGWDTSSTTSEF